jgi:hypothetical protein
MRKILYLSLISAITFISTGSVKAQSISDVPLAGDVAVVPQNTIFDIVLSILPYFLIPIAALVILYFVLKSKASKKISTKK